MTVPTNNGYLQVSEIDTIYWETTGSPTGVPVLFLHGGPGAGLSSGYKKHFDPSIHYIIAMDQRGCGRSTPIACENLENLHQNTRDTLIEDIEKLRKFLKVDSMMLVGISFGTFLAISYAQQYPQRVINMVLGAITSLSKSDITWITKDLSKIFPIKWKSFYNSVSIINKQSLVESYYDAITHEDINVRHQTAKAWCKWEDTHVSIVPDTEPHLSLKDPEFQLNFTTLVIHYWVNYGFNINDSFFERIENISHIPAVLIHGRMDISSPLDSVYRIHENWKESQLIIIENEGHGGPSMISKINESIRHFSREL
ncbi:MAG: prolyl aminopeptidase [Candidatus Cloacimonetes bacterium]|nr:prolyl aminopeptidase [Candidatus Cloacimonadota bacterium]